MLWLEFSGIHFEEIDRLLGMLASDIVEGTGGDVVGLALSNQRVVLKQILDLGSIRRCLRVQDPLCLGPKNVVSTRMSRICRFPSRES